MKKIPAILLVAAMMVGASASLACAGMYVSGNLIAVNVEDAGFSVSDYDYDYDNDSEMSFDTGAGFAAAVGFASPNGFRLEGELAGRYNEMDEVDGRNSQRSIDDGYVSAFSLMANGYYNFMPENRISPFIGAGVGVVTIEAELDDDYDYDDYDDDDDYYYDYDGEYDTVLAYQLSAGVTFALTEQMKIDVQYRYFASEDPEFDNVEMEYATHNAMVGLRYNF